MLRRTSVGPLFLALMVLLPPLALGQEKGDAKEKAQAADPVEKRETLPTGLEQNKTRVPLRVVLALDVRTRYRFAKRSEGKVISEILDLLEPGDIVRMATYGPKPEFLNDPLVLQSPGDWVEAYRVASKRPEPSEASASAKDLAWLARAYFDRHGPFPTEVPVLIIITASSTPEETKEKGNAWKPFPSDQIDQMGAIVISFYKKKVKVYGGHRTVTDGPHSLITGLPPGWRPEGLALGAIKDLAGTLELMRQVKLPVPPPPPTPLEASLPPVAPLPPVVQVTEVVHTTRWFLTGVGATFGVMLLGLLLLKGLRRKKRGQLTETTAVTAMEQAPEMTVLVRDRIRNQVLRQETFFLSRPIQIGPSQTADLQLPGPVSLVVVYQRDRGEASIGSSNSLGVVLTRRHKRAPVRVEPGETVPLREGDRVDFGDGVEVEFRILHAIFSQGTSAANDPSASPDDQNMNEVS